MSLKIVTHDHECSDCCSRLNDLDLAGDMESTGNN